MSTIQSQTIPSAAEMLEMAKLQIVAEAFLEGSLESKDNKVPTPRKMAYFNNDKDNNILKNIDAKLLEKGNGHTSILTQNQIADFISNWEVISYMPITDTGFSGTLFRAKQPIEDDKGNVIVEKDQLVMSFRSTEFIDDSARDNQATNTLEIAEKGWAFGQIDDMERWYQSLRESKVIGDGEQISLTGYSLGGHLATAFNKLHEGEDIIHKTYTFNGAGVGRKADDSPMDKESLQQIIKEFGENRRAESLEDKLDAITRSHYQSLKKIYQETKELISHDNDKNTNDALLNRIHKIEEEFIEQSKKDEYKNSDMSLLAEAVKRARIVLEENKRVSELNSGGEKNSHPPLVNYSDIAAANLDYQISVLLAARKTNHYPEYNPFNEESATNNIYKDERNVIKEPIVGFYDIYAKNPPSMVASSQLHYGTAVPIKVENQPLVRGEYTSAVIDARKKYHDTKLLVNNYTLTDFGDTHSIALLVDSL